MILPPKYVSSDAFVFFVFAAGADRWQNGSDVIVDYNTSDPLIRWDSYQNICDGEGTVTSPHDTQKISAGRPPNESEHPSGKRQLLLTGDLLLRRQDAVIISFPCFCSIMKTFLQKTLMVLIQVRHEARK